MKCNSAPATRKLHQSASKSRIHRRLSTHLYGTCKASRITGSSLTLAGTVAAFIPVAGWIVGPALIAGNLFLKPSTILHRRRQKSQGVGSKDTSFSRRNELEHFYKTVFMLLKIVMLNAFILHKFHFLRVTLLFLAVLVQL